MTPAAAIAMLDRFLARDGETVVLRRIIGAAVFTNIDVTCRASVNDYSAQELVGPILQTDSRVIMSPTEITLAQWPGGMAPLLPPFDVDQRIPRINDKLIVGGRLHNIAFVNSISMANVLVRIEMRIAG